MDIKWDFGQHLKDIRENFGFTQEELAEMIGKAPSTIQKIESGKRFPRPDTIEKLCEVFNISCMELFAFKQDIKFDMSKAFYAEYEKLDNEGKDYFYKTIKLYNKAHNG